MNFHFHPVIILFLALALAPLEAAKPIPNDALRPGDVLELMVFQEPDLESTVRLSATGEAIFPLIGSVPIAGLTASEAQELLFSLYNEQFLINPQINLRLVEYAPRRVQVLGQVNQPGFVEIPPEARFTLLQAIAGAEGLTRLGNRRSVQIRRPVNDVETKIIEVDLDRILSRAEEEDLPVYVGDTIFVGERLF